MPIDEVEAAYRARMRALAHKGGATTKRRYANDPWHYRDVGRLGGYASVAARKARIAAELDGVKPGGSDHRARRCTR
jgi:general stress protein YciG